MMSEATGLTHLALPGGFEPSFMSQQRLTDAQRLLVSSLGTQH
jgi:hypothetical protein